MNASILCVLLFLVLLAASKTTEHDNKVYFNCNNIYNFSFVMSDHIVSHGQPWDGVTSSSQENKGELIAKAGRHGTSDVAKWFESRLNGGQAVGINSGETSAPSNLNFAFIGNMSFVLEGKEYQLNNVVIGQGHYTTANNWWFGGEGWMKSDNSMFAAAVVYKSRSKLNVYEATVGYSFSTHGDDFGLSVQAV